MEQTDGRQERLWNEGGLFAVALSRLVGRVRGSCDGGSEWPDSVGEGLREALGFLVEERELAEALFNVPGRGSFGEPYFQLIREMSGLLEEAVPVEAKPGPGTPETAIAGIGVVVGNHVRTGRTDQLADLCPEMHLVVLLPFLCFEDARSSVEAFAGRENS